VTQVNSFKAPCIEYMRCCSFGFLLIFFARITYFPPLNIQSFPIPTTKPLHQCLFAKGIILSAGPPLGVSELSTVTGPWWVLRMPKWNWLLHCN